jgi:hypothetical protein
MALMLERADTIADTIRAAVEAAGSTLAGVTVTLDALDIPSGSRAGVVAILPPVLNFSTYDQTEADWSVIVVAGPATNMPAAWRRLDDIIAAIRTTAIPFETAVPDSYQGQDKQATPAYMLTLTETLTETE